MDLKPGEIICDKCNRTGDRYTDAIYVEMYGNKACTKCHGAGKLDWIETIVGKKALYFAIPWSTADQLYGPKINPIINEKIKK